ncbi:ATP synthase protein I [Alkalispirillum mobile]|uniref:ATP synthase protein I n=1 Tax=Alkalispirillum mobile TaxID=85925 RepID=A0A498BQV3_9GAMM|nr:ATP synthase subunit I [Alkalispirillum mobile]RLK46504.1 ATP synthase protein I [Alkalispirillum mobile]
MSEQHNPEAEHLVEQARQERQSARRLVWRIAIFQVGVGLFASGCWLLAGPKAAAAAFTGALIAMLPGLYFAGKVFSKPPEADPRSMLGAFYFGEAVKLILTAALFIIALQWFGGVFLPLITTYVAALSVHWLALLGALQKEPVRKS